MERQMNPGVDFYFNKAKKWREELEHLRILVLDCGLTETLKWGVPCYTLYDGGKENNLVLIHTFKEYCALLFFKGALLKDAAGLLIRQTENVQSARQIRFTHLGEILERESLIKTYILDAIAVERAGLKVEFKATKSFAMPDEFLQILEDTPGLKTAFESLTPGRQRAYLLYFSAPKQSKTRESRVVKSLQRILDGKGLDD